ncbi:thioredoxin-dependent thiol peroxidase [Candidatus Falkowbacteria bacterium]|uniref:thioredoxin-dependent peroxiredoxin n=1 Tax=Candidatus Buchananbacteria bacterium CG10_big_fil_rev_8_21_14_0_10_33_19 TaxID=1974525 RepID=A0A2H0W600_9BACT|nr:thioredoxin-dependent thiol peroxidase [Candidatus Falkowbacteria bacterium]PIS06070.1 MAG: thioredoxin-dependent thiol peroxidase [Candidatus Buchananbacteria bacterium CG10_big_fil_rev_8_21_14_0_10_33_19]
MALTAKQKAPSFNLPDQTGELHKLTDYNGKWLLLYFYPRDNTPGCAKEACTIRDNFADFKKNGVVVLGVSADSVDSHNNFASKYQLSFPILADIDRETIKAYGAWGMKKFMGKSFKGIKRISFLINPQGKIAKVYDKVKPADHAQEVLNDIKALK